MDHAVGLPSVATRAWLWRPADAVAAKIEALSSASCRDGPDRCPRPCDRHAHHVEFRAPGGQKLAHWRHRRHLVAHVTPLHQRRVTLGPLWTAAARWPSHCDQRHHPSERGADPAEQVAGGVGGEAVRHGGGDDLVSRGRHRSLNSPGASNSYPWHSRGAPRRSFGDHAQSLSIETHHFVHGIPAPPG
jgi:hypothetical protein